MNLLPHLATRIFDTPLCIQPAKLDVILNVLGERIGYAVENIQLEVDAEALLAARSNASNQKAAYSVNSDGIAVVNVTGTLMKATSGLSALSGCTSYSQIQSQIQDAMASPNVKGVLLAIDSPGGETGGLFELADAIYSLRGQKPLYAVADDGAYSAAYAIASAADKIYVTRTGGVGSIGVFSVHVDQSKADEKQGLKYTFIKAGEKKAAGNAHEPLSESAQSDVQAEIDRQYDMFVSLVARNRGMTQKSVAATEAGVYFADNAVKAGLADAVGTFDDAMTDLTQQSSSINNKQTVTNTPSRIMKAEETMEKITAEEELDLLINAKKDDSCEAEMDEAKKSKAKSKADVEDDDDDDDDEKKKDDDADAKAKGSRADAIRIVNLCTLAGTPALAADFLAGDFTVAQVEKALLKSRATQSKAVKVSSGATKPANDFRSVAADLLKAGGANCADAFRKYLVANSSDYLNSMSNREFGENYKFAPTKRSF